MGNAEAKAGGKPDSANGNLLHVTLLVHLKTEYYWE